MSYGHWLDRVRQMTPLVHNITNLVVMQVSANALLAAGAAPVMAHAAEEVEDMASQAGALVVNIGTLDPVWVRSMERGAAAARAHRVPLVLDPVGAGATPYRTEVAKRLIQEYPPAVLRGNAGEISVLAGGGGQVRGVDAGGGDIFADEVSRLARTTGGVVAATGAVDVVSDGTRTARVRNGDPWLQRVTGTGCSLSALVGAFVATTPADRTPSAVMDATVAGLVTFEVAAERARQEARGPGSFHAALMDALFLITPDEVDRNARVSWD